VRDPAERPDRQQGLLVHAAEEERVVRAVTEEVLRDRREYEGADQQQDDRDPAGDRDAVLLEAAPDLLPVAARLDVDVVEIGRDFVGRGRSGQAAAAASCSAEELPLDVGHGARTVAQWPRGLEPDRKP